ncbi:MAG: hypothetical protein HY360_23265 [Verrucomicrobia bacterium]|nr:hypothetical protein [Verrucomicrobiota bacterium]
MSRSSSKPTHAKGEAAVLPYRDAKAVGAADFYLAINATFRFMLRKLGMSGLKEYWTNLGTRYYAPVSDLWKKRGLEGVAAYWRSFFKAEPGADVKVSGDNERVVLNVKVCPAIRHLRKNKRKIVSCFCQHCYYVSEAMAAPAGLTVRIEGGNGRCRQVFQPLDNKTPPQDFAKIKEAA